MSRVIPSTKVAFASSGLGPLTCDPCLWGRALHTQGPEVINCLFLVIPVHYAWPAWDGPQKPGHLLPGAPSHTEAPPTHTPKCVLRPTPHTPQARTSAHARWVSGLGRGAHTCHLPSPESTSRGLCREGTWDATSNVLTSQIRKQSPEQIVQLGALRKFLRTGYWFCCFQEPGWGLVSSRRDMTGAGSTRVVLPEVTTRGSHW